MSELKRTQLYDVHVAAGATMVDFGGWEMPIQYPSGIIAEHLYTRQVCGLFDVSHMGRLLIEGPQRKEFLQHVLTSNVSALDLNMAQYCIIPNENGGAVDDAYLYLFQEDSYLLVVNAANIDKDLEHLNRALSGFDCTITNISDQWASIAVQGPKSTGFRKTGSTAPTPGRQILLDSTMAANPKLTKAMRAASKRAAERDLQAAVASKNGTSDGTTGVTNAKNAKKSGHNNATMSRYAHREKFVKDMKKNYTIVGPQMSPIHMSLVEAVIRSGGYKFDILKHASRGDVETGLKYVNNDACYPAIMVIGQLIGAIQEGKYDPDKVALAITQTGGMCRATNYFGLIRKALVDAGYPQIPVIAISTQGLEDNPGFKATLPLLHRAIKALILGDLLMKCLYRVRPYEVEKGSANKLYELWDTIVRETIEHHGYSKTAAKAPGIRKGYLPYNVLAKEIVKSFDNLPLRDIPRKVRVGVVGEILVKYQPDANNHVVDVIESQDCEAVVPGIMEFMTTRPYITDWNERNLGMGGNKTLYALMRKSLDLYNAPIKAALATSNGKFKQDEPMPELVKKAAEVTSIGVQAGEGWLLTAEILELIEQGCPNVICAQPFACLPNHVTGRGMFGKIRRLHPEANIVSIDYDPGASEANQLNRIKLMIAAAKKAHNAKFAEAGEPQGFTSAD